MKTCGINRCDRPAGGGTHTTLTKTHSEHSFTSVTAEVCEEHWQAIRSVPYLRDKKVSGP